MEPPASIDDLLAAIHAVTQPGPENATLTDDQYAAKKERQSLVKKWAHIAVIKTKPGANRGPAYVSWLKENVPFYMLSKARAKG